MKTLKIYQVDAFAERLFTGIPAAVCVLDGWLDDALMQNIAIENNLSETAFVIPRGNEFAIRWFTPGAEVALCGHATLASAYVLFELLKHNSDEIIFHSMQSGILKVFREEDYFFLDFPSDHVKAIEKIPAVQEGIGCEVLELYKGKTDLLAVVESEQALRNIKPDFLKIAALDARGLIVTSRGGETDFVSRFFAPQVGVPEDPVTGSAHTLLISVLGKKAWKK